MQMIQFLVVFVHGIIAFIHPTCEFSTGLNLILMFNGCLYWFLFLRFYRKAYNKNKTKEKNPKLDENCNNKED